jgi:hypothetical protein
MDVRLARGYRRRMLRRNACRVAAAALFSLGANLLAPPAPVLASGSSFRVTEYRYRSEPGDWIGQGLSATVSDPSQILVTSTSPRDVRLYVGADGGWDLEFKAPAGQVLSRGVYPHAERAVFASGRAPGMDVNVDHRGCNEIFGRFAVNRIKRDAAGSVVALDIRFTQRCEAADAPALRGWIRYRATPLSYSYRSDPGDPFANGTHHRYESATSLFRGSTQIVNGVEVSVSGDRDRFDLLLQPPTGSTLTEGAYVDDLPDALADDTHPAIYVTGNGLACNEATGSFDVSVVRYDASGVVRRLVASFEQHCDGAIPALHGEIRFHA